MIFINRRPLICAFLLVFFGIAGGAIFGWIYAGYEIQITAEQIRRTHPGDPFDGLWIIGLRIFFKSLVIGTIAGIASGIIIFLLGKRIAKRLQ